MTPAVKAAQAAGVVFKIHEYAHDPANTNYGHEAAEVLGLDPSRVFKTLLVALNGDAKHLAVAVVPVASLVGSRRALQRAVSTVEGRGRFSALRERLLYEPEPGAGESPC